MFSTKNVEKLTKDNILKYVNEYDIFKYYFKDFEIGSVYNSPLRKDTNPSFNIYYNRNNILVYKDFGHSNGDCFTFVQNLHNIPFFQALQLINKDFNLKLNDNICCIDSRVYYKTYTPEVQKKETLIQVISRPFKTLDRDYWTSYGICRDMLLEYGVIACEKVFKDRYLYITHRDDNPIYAYLVNNQLKIYKPLEKNKRLKWFSNMKSDNLFGLEQLNKTVKYPYLFITSSLKDIMVLRTIGIYAVAPIAEGVYITDEQLEILKSLSDNIIVNFDSDNAGVNYSKKLTERIGCSYWNIPKEYEVKDISDFRKKYGYEKTKELLNKFIEWNI